MLIRILALVLSAALAFVPAAAEASCGDFVRGVPDHVLLARTCVSERGWRIETNDCRALYEVALVQATIISRDHPGYEVRDAICDLSPHLHTGEITRRRWLLDLEEDAHQPEGWTGARWTRREGCGDDREGRCRVARREDWIATLEETRVLFSDGEPRVCERPPRAWGSTDDLVRRRRCGYTWVEIECGDTENHYGILRAPAVPICGPTAPPSL